MRICINASFKFYERVLALKEDLNREGFECDWPTPCPRRDPNDMTRDPHENVDQARECVLNHFAKIEASDAVLMVNPQGYVGNSVIMELGYAYGLGKPIYSLEPLSDKSLMSLVTDITGPDVIAFLNHVCKRSKA